MTAWMLAIILIAAGGVLVVMGLQRGKSAPVAAAPPAPAATPQPSIEAPTLSKPQTLAVKPIVKSPSEAHFSVDEEENDGDAATVKYDPASMRALLEQNLGK